MSPGSRPLKGQDDKKTIYFVLCFIATIIGAVIGWNVGDKIGIAALPPNAWAGDGIGILIDSIHYSGWGALVGFGIGLACCLIVPFLAQRSRSLHTSPLPVPDDSVWPPPPAV